MIAYWGIEELGLKGVEIASYFNVKRPAINKLTKMGEKVIKRMDIKLIS
jgi:predicted DNA-binding protein YlxM (UPF0122 family)